MEQLTLECKMRETMGSRASKQVRRERGVPAVVYGRHQENLHVCVDREQLEHILDAGSRMVTLAIAGKHESVLIKAVQYDAMGDDVIHTDFVRVAMDERLELSVPVETVGTAEGTKSGGMMDLVHRELQVSCLPADIPDQITIRVTDMGIGDHIAIKDIELPKGVTALNDPETVVCVVHPPAVAEEAEEAEEGEEGAAEPEVIAKGKEEKGSEEANA